MKDAVAALTWTHEEMTGGFRSSVLYFFVGASCGRCKKTANVAHDAGWFCPCGEFNPLSASCHHMMHAQPDYGPTAEAIQAAILASREQPDQAVIAI